MPYFWNHGKLRVPLLRYINYDTTADYSFKSKQFHSSTSQSCFCTVGSLSSTTWTSNYMLPESSPVPRWVIPANIPATVYSIIANPLSQKSAMMYFAIRTPFSKESGQQATHRAPINRIHRRSQTALRHTYRETRVFYRMFPFESVSNPPSDELRGWPIEKDTKLEKILLHISKEYDKYALKFTTLHSIKTQHEHVAIDVNSSFWSVYSFRQVCMKKKRKEKTETKEGCSDVEHCPESLISRIVVYARPKWKLIQYTHIKRVEPIICSRITSINSNLIKIFD